MRQQAEGFKATIYRSGEWKKAWSGRAGFPKAVALINHIGQAGITILPDCLGEVRILSRLPFTIILKKDVIDIITTINEKEKEK